MNQFKALLSGFAAVVGAGGIAAYNGVFTPQTPPAQLASTPAPEVKQPEPTKLEPAPVEVAKVDPAVATEVQKNDPAIVAAEPSSPVVTQVPASAVVALAPVFDILRVEPNGSVLIAGKAEKDATVEVLSGADVLGVTKAQANGDFAIVIENPLKPGDYQLVLRSTLADGRAATSIETATVSVPDQLDGPVLALVEEPGKPSRIITAPEKPVVVAQVDPVAPAVVDPAKVTEPEVAKTPAVAEMKMATPDVLAIEAVEIEGNKLFIAGKANGAATVRLYANDIILGDTKPGEGDRFLLEIQKELAAGDYIIKAEGLAADGVTVVGRANVPFQRATDEAVSVAVDPAKEPVKPVAGGEPEKKKAVIIRRGDTLWQISRRIYGRGVRYSTIYLANKDAINNPNRIFPGQVVAIPDNTPEGDAANAEEIKRRETAE